MDRFLIQPIVFSTVGIAGAGLVIWSLRSRSPAVPTVARRSTPLSRLSSGGTQAQPLTHASWLSTAEPVANEPPAVQRRAAVLTGLQLTVLAVLLVGALYLTTIVSADQLSHLMR